MFTASRGQGRMQIRGEGAERGGLFSFQYLILFANITGRKVMNYVGEGVRPVDRGYEKKN